MKQTRQFTAKLRKTGEVVSFSVTVDWDELSRTMGARVSHNRSGSATTLSGAIKAKLVSKIAPKNSVD